MATKSTLKSDLEGERAINRDLCAEINRLNDRLASTQAPLGLVNHQRDVAKSVNDEARRQEEATGVTVYVASRSAGAPTCIYANGSHPDDDLAVALYLDRGRNIVGVVVSDAVGDTVSVAGLVPALADTDLDVEL